LEDPHVRTINPATEEPLEEHREHSPAEVDFLLRSAAQAQGAWRRVPMEERGRLLRRAGEVLRGRTAELGRLMALEMGKPITGGEAEVEKCAVACDYFAGHAAEYLAPQAIPSDATRSYVRYDPLGVVFAIMPWNFPFWQVFRFAAPALMAGNVGVLKHAENVPGCALAIERVFRDAGFPPGVFSTLMVARALAESVIRHPAVRAVTLTGSERAGTAVASQSGGVLKKTVLELGGSDPFIVIPPSQEGVADFLHETAEAAAQARCINSGQSCIAAKRFIIVGGWTDPFEQHLAAVMKRMKMGNPLERDTQMGPLARLDLLWNLDRQVRESVAAGAHLVSGGRRAPGKGYFYEPTVLSEVTPGMPAFDEETFGPVAAVIAAENIDEAIHLANQTPYGLGASVWTRDAAAAERIAAEIEAGCVFVNGPVKSDPRLPFGGIKQSGYGRELAAEGIREFVNIKTVWVKEAEQARAANRAE
jgi:succinate-semialdehyde dehydrogenase/glutarate-semialdehyde dehydrogenase